MLKLTAPKGTKITYKDILIVDLLNNTGFQIVFGQ